MTNFNIEHIFINGYRGAILRSCFAVMSAREEAKISRHKAEVVAERQNAEYLRQVEIFNGRKAQS